jgi:RNA polymerase sigma-70 factor (ECF subfamily)
MENRSKRDNELANRSRVGDMSAFRALVDGHRERVISIAWRISGDFHAAEDLAQEAFVKAFEKLKEFDPGKGAFSSWL